MSTGKPTFVEFAAGSEPNLTLITADGGGIPAHYDVLRLVCSCLRNAPASDTWDLSSLLVNGSPVSQSTVTAVLEVIYSSLGALDFQPPHAAGQYSLAQLLDMLLFADAVGCSRAVLTAVAELLRSGCVRRQLEVTWPAESDPATGDPSSATSSSAAAAAEGDLLVVLLRLDGVYDVENYDEYTGIWGHLKGEPHQLTNGCRWVLLPRLDVNTQQKQRLLQQAAAQLEALLWVGFKLDLQQLLAPGLGFLRQNVPFLLRSMVYGIPNAVFTQRVLASMSGADSGCAAALVRGLLQRPVGLCLQDGMFSDVVYSTASKGDKQDSICFEATLAQDVFSFKKGTWVNVWLCGGNGRMYAESSYGDLYFEYDIVLGPHHMFNSSS
ncbi:hypothetical protein OEZ86_007336 [Tetradesmus obliquus]|nr:hypothetical protein OEZ86_007336 [Tetradesmus obliquus]